MPYPRRSRSRLVGLVLALSALVTGASSRALAADPGTAQGAGAGLNGGGPTNADGNANATAPLDLGKTVVPPGLEDVGVEEHLDGQIPLDAVFRDQNGKMVRFGDLLDGKRPMVLTLAYHTCPTVCSLVLSQTVESLKKVGWSGGKEYTAVTLSFDPRETLERTVAKRNGIVADYGRPTGDAGWTFLFGNDANIHRVTDAVGFKYHYVEREQQFAHPTVILIVKPNGQVARYLYGLEYSPQDVRLGLLEASNGRSITTVDRILLYCYHYDPNSGRYAIVATRVMQVGAGLCGLGLIAFLATFWIKELLVKRRAQRAIAAALPTPAASHAHSHSHGGT
jgi:protein SCO1/2